MTDSSKPQAAPEAAQSAPRLFDLLGGEPGVRRLVDAFYDRMDRELAYAGIRALHPPTTQGSRNKFFWFLCGWSGGPDHFVQRFGHPRLRARHLPYAIGSAERDQWLHCMQQTLVDIDFDPVLADRLLASFFQTADWMRNKPD